MHSVWPSSQVVRQAQCGVFRSEKKDSQFLMEPSERLLTISTSKDHACKGMTRKSLKELLSPDKF